MRKLVAVAVALAVVASLLTYVTFSTTLRISSNIHNVRLTNDLPTITMKAHISQPTLIIKVNGKEKVRMKDPFTKYAFAILSLNMIGQGRSILQHPSYPAVGPDSLGGVKAYLYSTQFTDIVNAINPGTPNITLTTASSDITDNGTVLTANITVTGISAINVNITAVAMVDKLDYVVSQNNNYIDRIMIATNLPSPLTLSINDTIVIQWIITINYGGNVGVRPILYHFLQVLCVPGTDEWNVYILSTSGSSVFGNSKCYIGNGTDKTLANTQNYLTNETRLNNYYAFVLCYFDSSVTNPSTFAIYSYEGNMALNVSVTGLGADRAVLLKLVLSVG